MKYISSINVENHNIQWCFGGLFNGSITIRDTETNDQYNIDTEDHLINESIYGVGYLYGIQTSVYKLITLEDIKFNSLLGDIEKSDDYSKLFDMDLKLQSLSKDNNLFLNYLSIGDRKIITLFDMVKDVLSINPKLLQNEYFCYKFSDVDDNTNIVRFKITDKIRIFIIKTGVLL